MSKSIVILFILLVSVCCQAGGFLPNGSANFTPNLVDNWQRNMSASIDFTSNNYADDADNSAPHASVIDFVNDYNMTEWPPGSGYKYWMASTAIEPEYIALFVSFDGVDWFPAPKHSSQSSPPNTEIVWPWGSHLDHKGYWARNNFCIDGGDFYYPEGDDADVNLKYDPDNDQLIMHWARNRSDTSGSFNLGCGDVKNYLPKTSIARATVSNTYYVTTPTVAKASYYYCQGAAGMCYIRDIAPVVVREDANNWHMWARQDGSNLYGTNSRSDGIDTVVYAYSKDGINWGAWQDTNLSAARGWVRTKHNYIPWHFEAKQSPYDTGKAYILISAYPANSWGGSGFAGMSLFFAEIDLSNPTQIDEVLDEALLTPVLSRYEWNAYYHGFNNNKGTGYFDGLGLYQGTFSLTPNGMINVWYVGFEDIPTTVPEVYYNYGATARVGLTTGQLFGDSISTFAINKTPAPFVPEYTPEKYMMEQTVLPEFTTDSYTTIQSLYDSISSGKGAKVKLKAGDRGAVDLMFDRDVIIRLEGGYDDILANIVSNSSFEGTLTINGGPAIITNLIIK